MTIREILDHVDRVKPNAFSDEDKMIWFNELEYAVQADILGMTEGFRSHVLSDAWTGKGAAFTADTVTIPGRLDAVPGGLLTIVAVQGGYVTESDLLNAAEKEDLPVLSAEVGGDETVITVPADTFSVTGTLLTSKITVTCDMGGLEPIAPAAYHKIYPAYLEARIEAANGEWTEYDNAMALFNGFLGEFQRWYARNYIDNPEKRA